MPRACRPYRAQTKGKVERPYRYVREDFFLARSFRDLDDLNAQFEAWRTTVANARVHATTRRVVEEHFAQERPALIAHPVSMNSLTHGLRGARAHVTVAALGETEQANQTHFAAICAELVAVGPVARHLAETIGAGILRAGIDIGKARLDAYCLKRQQHRGFDHDSACLPGWSRAACWSWRPRAVTSEGCIVT